MDAIVYDKVGKEAEKVREALYGIYPQETITDAAIASFDDGADGIPVKALTVGVEPVQDLHGYDSPWPAGGGENILDPNLKLQAGSYYGLTLSTTDGWNFSYTGTATSSGNIATNNIGKADAVMLPAGTYIGEIGTMSLYNSNGSLIRNQYSNVVFTMDEDFYVGSIYFEIVSGRTYNINAFLALAKGSVVPAAWTPYSNICPISGWTGAEVTRTGVNVWDEEWRNGYYSNGVFFSSSSTICSKNLIRVLPNRTYYIHSGALNVSVAFYDADKNYITGDGGYHKQNNTFTTPNNCYYIQWWTDFGTASTYNNDISINYPATDTEYHPYTGSTLSLTFPSSAGTVYGATMTLNPDRTGTLVMDRAMVDVGDLTWTYSSSSGHERFISNVISPSVKPAPGDTLANTICSMYKTATSNQVYAHSADCIFCVDGDGHIQVYDSSYTDATAFKTAVTGQKIVYELATPQTYQLTESEISGILETLYGTNNIWADTGNIEKLTYRADLGKYIDSHITTAVANALNA